MTLNPNPRWSIAGLRQSFAFLLLCSLPFVAVLSGSDLYLHFLPMNQLTSERLVLMGLMMRPFAKENCYYSFNIARIITAITIIIVIHPSGQGGKT